MCTYITEPVDVTGSAKGARGWQPVVRAHVAYDHPQHLALDHALEIDLVDPTGARVAVELTAASARALVAAIGRALERGEAETGEAAAD
jgi:uncharacterized protein DUF6295